MSEEKESKSSETDEENKSETKSKVLKGVCCILFIIIFYAALGLVIHAFQNSSKEDKGMLVYRQTLPLHFFMLYLDQGPTLAVDFSTCTANSFLLGDGVCDDITNNEKCLFDEGDCCLGTESSLTYCKNCSCTVTGSI